MLVVKATCPNCGAPLGMGGGLDHVLCKYCNVSLRIEAPAPGAPASEATKLVPDAVPPQEIEAVKQLVLDGRREEAIARYARAASVPTAAAESAVDQLLMPTVQNLLQQVPLNTFGFVLAFVLVGSCGGGAAWSARGALDGEVVYWGLAGLLAFGAIRHVVWFVPKAVSTFVQLFGAKGRARVLKLTILRPNLIKGGTVALVAFEVQPADGGASFVDEEVLLLREASVGKLQPGNVVMVRYDEPARKRVFPTSPITVVGRV